MSRPATAIRTIADPELAKRFKKALDASDRVPPENFGRLQHIADELRKHFQIDVSRESVRKWIGGESRPRPDKMRALATILKVNEGWLSLGINPSLTSEEERLRPKAVNAAILYVAGVIGMNGATTAFPDVADPQSEYVNFYAILNGRQHLFYVSLGEQHRSGFKFSMPNNFERIVVIAVVPGEGLNPPMFKISSSAISKYGSKKGGYIEVLADYHDGEILIKDEVCKRISKFEDFRN